MESQEGCSVMDVVSSLLMEQSQSVKTVWLDILKKNTIIPFILAILIKGLLLMFVYKSFYINRLATYCITFKQINGSEEILSFFVCSSSDFLSPSVNLPLGSGLLLGHP